MSAEEVNRGDRPDVALADVARRWPGSVQAAIRGGAFAVLARTEITPGPVLDLGTSDARSLLRDVADDLAKPPHLRRASSRADGGGGLPERYAAVVSWGACTALPDLVGALGAVRALLAPGGSFLFSEPIGHPGVGHVIQASVEARRPDLRELHLGRDLNAAMREAGFVIDSVHRRRVEGVPLLLRYLAYGRACIVEQPDDDPSEGARE